MERRRDRTDTYGAIGCGLTTAAIALLTIFVLVAIAVPTGFGGQ